MPRTVVGIDVGGTFTDIAVLQDGRLSVHKLPSTPQNPSLGIVQGVGEVGVDTGTADFVHGSTVATNALLEGKGSRTALVTTMGFEDVLEIGRQSRAELYNLEQDRAPALAPWELRFGLSERVDYTGAILEDLQPDAVEALMALIAEAGADAVAVSFLFSFLNPSTKIRSTRPCASWTPRRSYRCPPACCPSSGSMSAPARWWSTPTWGR